MARFARTPERQTKNAIYDLKKNNSIKSLGTERNYRQALTRAAHYIKVSGVAKSLAEFTPEQAHFYLSIRGEEVGQKTLDMDRQAIQCMMQNHSAKLMPSEKLAVVKSELDQALTSRAYTEQQAKVIAEHQTEKHALSTCLAYRSGLRAHELLTLKPATEQSAHKRTALASKFEGREGEKYTVKGKGGLIREVLIPSDLAQQLEGRRFNYPLLVIDREIKYEQHYDIGSGKNWSSSVSSATERAMMPRNGAHGLRHSYAQERMQELEIRGYSREIALETVSQEMGHFRPSITETYLR